VGTVPDGLKGLIVDPGIPADPSKWQGASLPVEQGTADGRTQVTITQSQQKAILTWQKFDVGQQTDLHFDQTAGGAGAGSWIALNRVLDPSLAPSRILGSIRAEGQVYVLNRNGILFGGTSQVNVSTLVLSGLDIVGGDARFRAGIVADQTQPTFGGLPPGVVGGSIRIEPGARISIGGYGQAVLVGGQVVNGGTIEAPDGQVLLAAGDSVSLQVSLTPDVRGYRAFVQGGRPVDNTGLISVPRGNITLLGGCPASSGAGCVGIGQHGMLTATTGAAANGSIFLGTDGRGGTDAREYTRVELGPGSVTQIIPDDDGKKFIGFNEADFQPSELKVAGRKVFLLGDASVYVPSGNVELGARLNPGPVSGPDDSRIYVDAGARVDVSGLRDVAVASTENTLTAQLRANELRDNPVLRASPLRGKTVFFDARRGTQVADVSGYYGLVQRGVQELMVRGGSITLTGNEIVTRPGSVLDLSGGSVQYQAGYVTSTVLIDSTGKRVRIEDAVPGVAYQGIDGDFVVTHGRWGITETYSSPLAGPRRYFEPAYVQGARAGTLVLSKNPVPQPVLPGRPDFDPAPASAFVVLDGAVVASIVVGPKQLELPSASTSPTDLWREQPAGATLTFFSAGNVTIQRSGTPLPGSFGPDSALDPAGRFQHALPGDWFDGHTFSNVTVRSPVGTDPAAFAGDVPTDLNLAPGGHLVIPRGEVVNLGAGGVFTFEGKTVDLEGKLLAPGGSVVLVAQNRGVDSTEEAQVIRLGATGVIDVAGRWRNGRLTGGPAQALNGGTISLTSNEILLPQGSLLDVSGGGRLAATGTKVTAGKGGSITLDISGPPNPSTFPQRLPYDQSLVMDGELRGYALGPGGALTLITSQELVIGSGLIPTAGPTLRLISPDFFDQGGFSSFSLVGERGVTVTSGTTISPQVQSLTLPTMPSDIPTGTLLTDVLVRRVRPSEFQGPVSISLSTTPVRSIQTGDRTPNVPYSQNLVVEEGAAIRLTPGSTLKLSSVNTLYVDGTLEAPGGTISLVGSEAGAKADLTLGAANVRLGEHARILAPGYVRTVIDGGLARHDVISGGTIVLSAASGRDLLVDPLALLDVSGIQGTADVLTGPGTTANRYVSVVVSGDAGNITVSSSGGVLAGSLRLGPGAPGVGGQLGNGGTLAIRSPVGLVIRQDALPGFGSITARTTSPQPELVVIADRLDESGADAISLSINPPGANATQQSRSILFDGDVSLQATRSLTLSTTILGTTPSSTGSRVSLSARDVVFKGESLNTDPVGSGTLTGSTLSVDAEYIDFSNSLFLGCFSAGCAQGGFDQALFRATHDVRFSDHGPGSVSSARAGLFSPGALQFDAAQVYVTRLLDPSNPSVIPGVLISSGQSITVLGNGQDPPVPFSYGNTLTLRAPRIDQGGVLRAPQGRIVLQGTGPVGSVNLLPGSVTSASLDGATVLFNSADGQVLAGGVFVAYAAPGSAPEKAVRLDAPKVSVQPGAVVDVSGGGDLLGYSFIGGNGGSKNILGTPGAFAILPARGTTSAPAGGAGTLQDPSIQQGDVIWLQGVPGLADGYYTRLPAQYALLPGALLIQPLGGAYATAPATTIRADGAAVAAGYLGVEGTAIRAPTYGRYAVMSPQVFGQYSDLRAYSFNDYARQIAAEAGVTVRVPDDAGSLVLNASQSLLLQGTGRFGAGPSALLGNLDISAPRIAVVGSGLAPPDGTYLTLDVDALEKFGAGSILIGGTRSQVTDPTRPGTVITVSSTEVVVNTGAASPFSVPELILAAKNSVSVLDGSVVQATGQASRDTSALLLQGDSAVLRASTGSRVGLIRTDTPSDTPVPGVGILSLGNSKVSADGSLTLYGSQNIVLAPGAQLSGRQFDLASTRVNLGDAPAGTAGTTLGSATLAQLSSSADLLIRGTGSIHLYSELVLGGRNGSGAATLQALSLDTGLLQGEGAGGAQITAGSLTLRNTGGGAPASGGAVGTLNLDADALALGPGQVQLAGFATLSGAAGSITLQGTGGLGFAGDATLSTGQVRAASGASYALTVGGALALTHRAGTVTDGAGLGGRVLLTGSSVLVDTAVSLPGGELVLTSGNGPIQLGSSAALDVSGRALDFQGQPRFAPGGSIILSSAGDLVVAAGATLDVSGSPTGGDAGSVQLLAGGTATLSATPRASTFQGAAGGSFSLDAARVTDLSALNGRLEQSGFSRSRSYRVRVGDLVIASTDRITAHEVTLEADTGRVDVAGQILAAGDGSLPDGGRVRLVGGSGVTLEGTASIDARAGQAAAGGFDPASGNVELVALGGRLDVAPGSLVDVSGGRTPGGGLLVLRAPRTGNDLAIDRVAGTVRARSTVVQGSRDYQASVVDAALVAQLTADAAAWIQNAAAIRARLLQGNAGLPDLVVAPAIAVTSVSDLAVKSTISLNGLSAPGDLRLSAGRDLSIQTAISDGFSSADRTASLSSGRSFALALEAGRDVAIAANAMVRTGTGNISVTAGRDLLLQDPTSVIYTSGAKTAGVSGFLGAPGELPTDGGDITLSAGRDIRAPFPSQTTSAWLFRTGGTQWTGDPTTSTVMKQTSWSIVYANFESAVGALGGGDVRVRAGEDVVRLQVAIPTTGQLSTPVGGVPRAADLTVRGGGNLTLSAGRDVLGGVLMLGRGQADVRAGGSIVASADPADRPGLRPSPTESSLTSNRPVALLIGLMDAKATVVAAGDLDIEAAYDPMRQGQVLQNKPGGAGAGFVGYTSRTALSASSLGGNVRYENDPWASVDLTASAKPAYQVRMTGGDLSGLNLLFGRAPPTLRLTSLESNAALEDPFGGASALTLGADNRGTLEVLARGNVRVPLASVTLEDVAQPYRRGPLLSFSTADPLLSGADVANLTASGSIAPLPPSRTGDQAPVRLYALNGSVCLYRSGSCLPVAQSVVSALISPAKSLDVYAGKDVVGGSFNLVGLDPSALSEIHAGRDIFDAVVRATGTGSVVLDAGRNFVQHLYSTNPEAASGGLVQAQGNGVGPNTSVAPSPFLPSTQAANVFIVAGTSKGVDLDGFTSVYLDPANTQNVPQIYLPELGRYLASLGYGPLSPVEQVAAFRALPAARQEVFLYGIYFNELKQTGIDYNDPQGPRFQSYDRGFKAISTLFPGSASARTSDFGDVLLAGKPVETWSQGDVTIAAPYGRASVGTDLASTSSGGGVVTRRGGDIRIMANQNIDLFTSRVFTLQGGDITMWTSNGSITAGAGSQTSVLSRPLTYTTSADGVVKVNVFGLQTGAGIGVLDAVQGSGPNRKRSRLDLIAPRGEVNAGDAGIRVVGDLNIAAQIVVGVENIQVSGSAVGVPKVNAVNVAALSTASQLTQAASKEGVGPSAAPKNRVEDLPSIVTVEVVGYETTDKTPEGSEEKKKKGK